MWNWKNIFLSFTVWLVCSNESNAIWVVVDKLCKMKHLVPWKDHINALWVTDIFIKYITNKNEHSDYIFSNTCPKFASVIRNMLTDRWWVVQILSLDFQQQILGQMEMVNTVLEIVLWNYVNYLLWNFRRLQWRSLRTLRILDIFRFSFIFLFNLC